MLGRQPVSVQHLQVATHRMQAGQEHQHSYSCTRMHAAQRSSKAPRASCRSVCTQPSRPTGLARSFHQSAQHQQRLPLFHPWTSPPRPHHQHHHHRHAALGRDGGGGGQRRRGTPPKASAPLTQRSSTARPAPLLAAPHPLNPTELQQHNHLGHHTSAAKGPRAATRPPPAPDPDRQSGPAQPPPSCPSIP